MKELNWTVDIRDDPNVRFSLSLRDEHKQLGSESRWMDSDYFEEKTSTRIRFSKPAIHVFKSITAMWSCAFSVTIRSGPENEDPIQGLRIFALFLETLSMKVQ